MPAPLFSSLPRHARSEIDHTATNLAALLTAAGYLDVRARIDGYPSPRLHPAVLDMPDVTAVSLHGGQEVFYVITESHLAGSDLLRPWRTLLTGCGKDVRAWLVVPKGKRPTVKTRLMAMGVQAHVLEL